MARILVVDDNSDILNLVQTRLRKAGHVTLGAESGDRALSVVDARGAPDVCVLDVDMPGMTGLQLAQHLRIRFGDVKVPIIFLSAKVQPGDIAAGQSLGATYLTKPFVASALLHAIEKALPGPEAIGW